MKEYYFMAIEKKNENAVLELDKYYFTKNDYNEIKNDLSKLSHLSKLSQKVQKIESFPKISNQCIICLDEKIVCKICHDSHLVCETCLFLMKNEENNMFCPMCRQTI